MALLGRMEDPECARGGRFLVREAALAALLRMGSGGDSVKLVMHRLKDESWKEKKDTFQVFVRGCV